MMANGEVPDYVREHKALEGVRFQGGRSASALVTERSCSLVNGRPRMSFEHGPGDRLGYEVRAIQK